jgi:hypothetical protein
MYDECAYSQTVSQSVSPMTYIMDPMRYENANKCRIELGTVGGTAVSHVNGNLIDLENNLMGLDRPYTHCSAYKHTPPVPGQPYVQGREYIKPVCHPKVDTTMRHLASCQIQSWPGVAAPPQLQPFSCPAPFQR